VIKKLFSVVIRTGELAKLSKFYGEALGLKVTRQTKGEVVFDLGGTALVLHLGRNEKTGTAKVPAGAVPEASRTSFAVLVDDVDALYKSLKKSMEFPSPPENEDWGARTVSGFDPDGNKIDFIEKKAAKA
jgi:extradiol dioxygenase family protein